jgi:hypothetical protein
MGRLCRIKVISVESESIASKQVDYVEERSVVVCIENKRFNTSNINYLHREKVRYVEKKVDCVKNRLIAFFISKPHIS